MSLYRVIHSIFGEYVFSTNANDFARFSGSMTKNGFRFWDSRHCDGRVSFCVSVFSAERIASLAKESSVMLECVAKRGLPFVFARYRRRYGMLLGLVVGLFLMLWSQLFVWKVTVSGNIEVPMKDIERALSECGIEVGGFIPDIDTLGDANRVLMTCRELSSVAVSINGTHVHISVLERRAVPEIVNRNGFFNVVASHDGVILDIDAAEGTPEVHEGEAVYKGELLINSFIEGKNGSFRPTHARGSVYAAVSKSFTAEIPLSRVTKNYTGENCVRSTYTVLGIELPSLFGKDSGYEYFDSFVSEKYIKLFGFIELPIKEQRIVYSEYVPVTQKIDEAAAEGYAYGELDAFIAENDMLLLSCEHYFVTDKEKGVCKLVANAVFRQDIAKEVPFEILNYNISERFESARE